MVMMMTTTTTMMMAMMIMLIMYLKVFDTHTKLGLARSKAL